MNTESSMKLKELIDRSTNPNPWSEGDNIPWNDPDFSKRMLREHLSQEHDLASRREEKIAQHVNWIHHHLLSGNPTKILDLGCGPGLYTSRLAARGHKCVGIDYSPSSISYARDTAILKRLDCEYQQADMRNADFGTGFGAVMQIFGELNVFQPTDAESILRKAFNALDYNGLLILEVHTLTTVQNNGELASTWTTTESGLFSEHPHLMLQERFWDPERKATTIRYFIVDASTGIVSRYAQSLQGYTKSEYCSMVEQCGFEDIHFFPSLTGVEDATQRDFIVIVARKLIP